MTLANLGMARSARRDSSLTAAWPRRALVAALPFGLILVWSAAVRLPFYWIAGGDEFFFAVFAREWLHGGLPYVTAFDVKPPGLFFVYAVAQALFGDSYATIKGMEIVAVAAAASSLYAMLRSSGLSRLAIWCAVLYPVYTLAFHGTSAVNVILQLPFIVAAFAAVVAATGDDVPARRRLIGVLLAGLAIGAAGMIKQTAVFEAAAAFAMLAAYGARGARAKMLALFVVGAALPAVAFSAYFLAVGHFSEMFHDVVVLAMQRVSPDVAAVYGPALAGYLTLPGALANAILSSSVVVFLWGGAISAALRFDLVRSSVPTRLLVVAASWLALSLAGAVFGRMLFDYYLLVTVPPLLILAGAFFCHGLQVAPSRRAPALWLLSIVLGAATLVATEHVDLFDRGPLQEDPILTESAAARLHDLGLRPGDRLLAVGRGLGLYTATGALPPSPYFHMLHLLSAFETPSPDPLGETLGANPRFVVMSDTNLGFFTILPSHLKAVQAYLAAHYRPAAVVHGAWSGLIIYEFVR
jgi:4-amino-4-deoxy-L-arabinose transferase-like glycosyltransferase